ncbi:MAG TPA: putative Ig domain-containing protein [Candidatus Binatia bacterium]|jgi:hypothetical protein|nr:putative Ig domain-containing protein [Candidatus Binatia bacterium]
MLPASTSQLSATTSDSLGNLLRHWWAVTTTPIGAKPRFDHQGSTNATVSNLTLPGTYTFTLRAFNDLYMTTSNVTLIVKAAPGAPVITSPANDSVIVGTPYTYSIAASNGPTGFDAIDLPAGLTFANGVISGTPSIAGSCNILLVGTNASGAGYGNLALTVKLPLPVFTSSATADGVVNTPFLYTLQAANVSTSFSAINLPPGFVLNSLTGAITNTPTSAGTNTVIVIANNSTGSTTNSLTIIIYNGPPSVPVITSPLTATGSLSAGFNYQITAANYPTSSFAIGLPLGLSFDPASGRIFGIPSITGSFNVTLRALNSGGTGSASLALTITPEPPPKIDSITLRNGFALTFLALTNRHYAVQWLTNLLDTHWAALTSGIPGNAATQTVTDTTTNAPARFYRLKVMTP